MNASLKLALLFTVIMASGCSSESAAPQSQVEVNAGTSQAEENTDSEATSNSPEIGAAESTTTESPVNNSTQPMVSPAASDIPEISFHGTSVGASFDVGDTLMLDASNSTVDSGDIVSFKWEQIDNGGPLVNLDNAHTATASFAASAEIDGIRLNFRISVITSTGATKSSEMYYTWHIAKYELTESNDPEEPVEEEPAGDGSYVTGQSGDFHALSAKSLYVANQVDFTIDHINPVTDTVLNSYQLTAMPTLVEYVAATNSLYVGLATANSMVRIRLDTEQQTSISTDGEILSMASRADRIYYTFDAGTYEWGLGSVGDDNVTRVHGILKGDLIMPNPVADEIVAVRSGASPASVYRYSFDADGNVTETQSSTDLGSNARDLAMTKDGLRLAVVTGSGNGSGYTIHDIEASDLTVSSGAWDTDAYPVSADFSDSGTLFAASNTTDLMIFGAATHTLLTTHDVSEGLCGLNYYDLTEVLFSEDNQHVFAKLVCGFNSERTVFFYYTAPQ